MSFSCPSKEKSIHFLEENDGFRLAWHLAPAIAFIISWSLLIVCVRAENCPLITPPSGYVPAIEFNYSESPVTATVSAGLESTIKSIINDTVPQYAVSVVYGDRTVFTSGLATTPFVVGTIAKVLTALGALILLERGLLSLDDPVVKFLPDFKIINPYEPHNVTLRELMGHLSGFPRELCQGVCPVDESEVLQSISKMQLVQPLWSAIPGYSNLGFAVLGHAWEKATSPSKSWEQFIKEDIIEPLGLTGTGVDFTNVTVASAPNTSASVEELDVGWIKPAAQMYSTAADLARFLIFLMKGSPNLISKTSIREWTHATTIFPDRQSGFALPWELLAVNSTSDLVITKGGELGFFDSIIAFHPPTELGVSVLYLANESTLQSSSTLATEILNTLIPVVEASNQKIIDYNFGGTYVCNASAPIPSPSYNTTVEFLGGEIRVDVSPSLGIALIVNVNISFDGEVDALVNEGPWPLLLKDANESSFWAGLLDEPTCLAFASEFISAAPSLTMPNYPGSLYLYEVLLHHDHMTHERTLHWPGINAMCVKHVHHM